MKIKLKKLTETAIILTSSMSLVDKLSDTERGDNGFGSTGK